MTFEAIAREAERALRFHPDLSEHEKFCKQGNINVILAAITKANEEQKLPQRLYDLVRYCRKELHQAELITDEEYVEMCEWGAQSARRLEDYDALRAAENQKLREALLQVKELYPHLTEIDNILSSNTNGVTLSPSLADVLSERKKQDAKWGEQNHDPFVYLAILIEEVGEFAQAALHQRFGGHAARKLRNEIVQTAAVSLAIIESIDRAAALASTKAETQP